MLQRSIVTYHSILLWNIMSTAISAIQAAVATFLDISLLTAVQLAFGAVVAGALLVLFRPLLVGLARAALLLIKLRLSKEERLARRQMRDAMMLNRMLNAMDSGAPSHAAELRALSGRS